MQQAHGRVLAQTSPRSAPSRPTTMSAMDGYAVRAEDVAKVPATLKVIGEVAAGRPFDGTVGKGEAARIFTGGVVPDGADTIVIQENTTRDGDTVTVERRRQQRAGTSACAGLDFKTGDVLLPRGHRLMARDLALAAAMNYSDRSRFIARPKVAMLCDRRRTGAAGHDPGPGADRLFERLRARRHDGAREGAEVIDLGIVPDRLDETIAAVRRARAEGADVLVTTGGASVGEYDLVQRALAAEGMDLSFWKIAMRPGRPLMHGRHRADARARPARQSGVVLRLLRCCLSFRCCASSPDARTSRSKPNQRCSGCDLPANDERADYLRATCQTDQADPVATPFPGSGQFHDGPPRGRRLPCDSRAPLRPPAKAGATVRHR